MKYRTLLAATAAVTLSASPAMAQDTTPTNPIDRILGALFGERTPTGTVESQWNAGQTPLTNQRGAFEARVDEDLRSGVMTNATAARLKYDYYQLTQLETRYGADRRYTSQERQELAYGYNRLTQVLADGSYADNATENFVVDTTEDDSELLQGRSAFEQRVDNAVRQRQIRRSMGTRLKAEYTALIDLEAAYLDDGVLTTSESRDLESRLAALDARVGDNRYMADRMSARERLAAIETALAGSNLTSAQRQQLLVEHGDLERLEQAYSRISTNADERAYLDGRLASLEQQVNLR